MMSSQKPEDFNNDAPAPDFLQLLLSQQDPLQTPDNLAPGETPSQSTPASQSQLGPSGSPADDVNLSRWAAQRQAAYASLDAALERHINEAIRTVDELKRQAEADAARASYSFAVDRDNLRKEITGLRQEQARLRQQIEDARRAAQEEAVRQAQIRAEREELERQVTGLRAQLEEARRSSQSTRLEEQESGGRSRFFGRRNTSPVEEAAQEVASAEIGVKGEKEEASAPAFAPYAPALATGADFGDAKTPRIPGGSPVVVVTAATIPPALATPASPALPGGAVLSEPEFIRTGPFHAITPSTFAYLQELLLGEPPDLPMADVVQPATPPAETVSPSLSERTRTVTTGPLRLGATGNLERTSGLPPRRGQTDSLGPRPPKRRHSTGPLGSPPVQNVEAPAPLPVINPVAVPVIAETSVAEIRTRRSRTLSETEKQQKVVLRELGLQLGLADPMTPPALNSMSFAAGYTPPNGVMSLADMLDEINANVSAILPPLPEVGPATNGGKPAKKVVEPPPPISPDTNLDDYSIEEEPVNLTLQELLEAGEQELAAINEDPTPPENPTPFIGKIGSDHPVHFQPGPTITPKPEPLSMLNQEIETPEPTTQPLKTQPTQAREFRPLNIRSLRSREAQEISLPLSLAFPPLTNPANTRQTYVTITNLQGRYTLPMLEKTLRGLVGVAHVVVTDFNRQTLLMEVIHRPDFDLIAQLTTLPDLPLRLVNEGPGTFVFAQNSQ